MTTTLVTLIGDATDAIAVDFEARRTKAYVRYNTDKIVTDDGGPIHLGGGTVNLASDGTFSLPNVVASTSLVENLQATVYIAYSDPTIKGNEARKTATFGPYDLSAETGTVDIRDLEAVQALPATAISQATATLDAIVAEGQALLDAQEAISGLTGEDGAVALLIDTPGSDTANSLAASIAAAVPDASTSTKGRVRLATSAEAVTGTALDRVVTPSAGKTAQSANELQRGPRLPHTKRMTNPYLAKWDAAVEAVRAGTRDAKILVIGDSTAAGVGGDHGSTYPQQDSWPSFLAALLNEGFLPAQNGLQVPRSSSAGTPTDTRWTLGSGWSKGDGADATLTAFIGFGGMGLNYYANYNAAGTLTFNDPRITADTFDIYYLETTGAGATFTAQATGGSASASTPTGGLAAKGINKVTITAGSSATSNVVTITPGGASGAVYIVGIEPYLSGSTKRIRVGNAAASGSYAYRWAGYSATAPGNSWNALYSIRAYAPDLTIIDLGINDAAPTLESDPATWDIYLGQVIAAAQNSGDVILKTFIPVENRTTYQVLYAAKMRARALPLIDVFEAWGESVTDPDAAGFVNADRVHGTTAAYVVEAGMVYEALTRRPDGTRAGAPLTVSINGSSGQQRSLAFQTSGLARWLIRANATAESGSDVGSDLEIASRTDAGAAKLTVLSIIRSTGRFTFGEGVTFQFGTTTGTKLGATATNKLAFWGATPIVQPTRPGQITDSSGGTSGGSTIAAVTDVATAANAIATLAAKINALETILHNEGLIS